MGDRTSAWTRLSAVLAFRSSSERVGLLLRGARCAYQHLQARADSRSVMPLNVLGRTRTTMVL
jgi:hypothetical protein